MNLKEQLIRDEGIVLKMYQDTVGKWTIGVGHNLDDKPISRRAAEIILEDDINDSIASLKTKLPWTEQLDEVRKAVLINMAFNMGIGGLLAFKKMLTACKSGNFKLAAKEMLDSKWKDQVGQRAFRLAKQMETGEWQ